MSIGDPPNGGMQGYEKIAIFDQYLALCHKRYSHSVTYNGGLDPLVANDFNFI